MLLDCPHSLGLITTNAFVASDYLLIPVDAIEYSKQGLQRVVNHLGAINTGFGCNTSILGLYMAKYQKRERIYNDMIEYLKNEVGEMLFETLISKSTYIEQAPSNHKTIIEHDSQSLACLDYMRLTKEIMDRVEKIESEVLV